MRSMLALAVVLATFALTSCEAKKPVRMAPRPKGPIAFTDLGKKETIELAFFDEDGRPFIQKPLATFAAETDGVVEVKVHDDNARATVTPKRTGTTDVVIRAFDLEERVKFTVTLVASVELDAKTPTTMKLGATHQAIVVVKDDNGAPLKDAKVNWSASDYCIDVSGDGLVTAQAEGSCALVVDVMGKTARVNITVN